MFILAQLPLQCKKNLNWVDRMIDYYAIGQRIRQIRKARGLSQDQLAEQVGISTVHVSHIENANTKLSLPVFVRLTEVLQVPADELLQGAVPVRRQQAEEDILRLLDSCDLQQLRILRDVLRSVKESLDLHLS